MLCRLVITFLPRSKRLLISWWQLPSAMILEPPKIKSDTVSTVSPSISHKVMGPDAIIFVFWMFSFKPTFLLPTFTFIKGFLVPLHFLPYGWCHLHIWGYWYFSQQSWFKLVLLPAQFSYQESDLSSYLTSNVQPWYDLEQIMWTPWETFSWSIKWR